MNLILNLCALRTRINLTLDTALKRFALTLLALMLLPSFSFANIYRCGSDSGVVTYSDVPCGNNAVVAFEKHVVGVEEAARRNVIQPNTNRGRYDDLEKDILAHAQEVGSCIFPDKKLNSFSIVKGGKPDNVIEWNISERFGSEEYKSEWDIKISYQGKLITDKFYKSRTIKTIRLKTIKVSKNGQSFDPISMSNLKAFRKIRNGEWIYQR